MGLTCALLILYIKWITNKKLQYSTANCTRCSGALNGKEIPKRGDMCICVDDSLCCALEANTAL